jgi:hypothetical protein
VNSKKNLANCNGLFDPATPDSKEFREVNATTMTDEVICRGMAATENVADENRTGIKLYRPAAEDGRGEMSYFCWLTPEPLKRKNLRANPIQSL